MSRLLSPIIATCCALSITVACDSGEPSEGLRARLERERREEVAAEVERQLELEREKLEAQMAAERKSGLKVSLPAGAAMDIDPAKVSLVIEVPASGDVFVAGRAVTDADLDNLLRAAFVRAKDTQVIIRADRGVQHGRVVNIMERAKAVGLTRLAIATASAP